MASSPAAITVSVLVGGAAAVEIHFLKGGWGRGAHARGSFQVCATNGHDGGCVGGPRGSEEESMRPDSRYLAPGRGCINGGGGAAPSERISAVRLTRKTPESRHKDDGWLGGLLFVFPPERPGGVTANKL